MKTLCYVATDGEMLSNKEHPVTAPQYVRHLLHRPEDHQHEGRIEEKVYYATEVTPEESSGE